MSFAKRNNAALERPFTFEIPDDFKYTTLKDLVAKNGLETAYQVNAIYINKKGKYGDQPTLITNCEMVNAPHFLLDNCLDIIADGESCGLINKGHVGFTIYEYQHPTHGTQYSIHWVDL